MINKALDKAHRRLRVATEAVEKMSCAETYLEFADEWYQFLHSAKGVYTTLEQGSKDTAQSRQWFGAKNKERRDDELLRYICEARNDDEHGIEESTGFEPSKLSLGSAKDGSSRAMVDQFGNTFIGCGTAYHYEGFVPTNIPKLKALDGKPIYYEFKEQRLYLKPVKDRSKNVYNPPENHLGNAITDASPLAVAKLTVSYLERLLAEVV